MMHGLDWQAAKTRRRVFLCEFAYQLGVMQMENKQRGLGLFGTADDIAVQRGIAEFQAGRPCDP